VLVAALVVARPLVGAEHPGIVSDFSDPGGMVLTFLTLLACAAWAGWRLWRGLPALVFGWVDFAFLALALAVFLGAGHASYRRAAWLAGSDWLALALLVLLVRQLAVRPDDRHGLVALLLASVVALAAEGLFQALYEVPRQLRAEAALMKDRPETAPGDYLRGELAARGLTPTPLELQELQERYDNRSVYGPYYHPESFAAVLALGVPLLLGALVACVRGGALGWQTSLTAASLLITAAALVCTCDWVAIAAAGVVVLITAGLAWPARRGGRKTGVVLGVVGSATLVAGLWSAGLFEEHLERLREVWPASARMVRDHALLGVGPAQFALFYPRYMAETAGAKAVTAGDAVLEVWAEAGVFGVLALVALVVLFARAVRRWWRAPASGGRKPPVAAPQPAANAPGSPQPDAEPIVAWEFYLGGMIGLVLAFILRAAHLPGEDILTEALAAGVRAVMWFAAFGLFEAVAWSEEEQVGALTAGAAALFLCLLVQSGIDFPSVAVLLWVAVALTLAVVNPEPARWLSGLSAVNALAVPALVAGAFAYFAFVFYPAAASASAMRLSQRRGEVFLSELAKPEKDRDPGLDPVAQIQRALEPLEQAVKEDPDNVRLLVALSAWYGQLAQYSAGSRDMDPRKLALNYARRAREVNPEGPDGYLAEYVTNMNFARRLVQTAEALEKQKPDPKRPVSAAERTKTVLRLRTAAREHFRDAARALEAYNRPREPRDPHDPALKVLLAEALFGEGRAKEAREQARQAERLNEKACPPRNLTNEQRQQVEAWLKKESGR
jgi:tetratricopeptide (TPR) repeat protein